MATLDRVPTQIAPKPEAYEAAVSSIRAERPLTCVLCDDPAERSILLQSVIETVANLETRFVHVGNPLRAPLTVERLFMQAVGPEADVRLERDAATLTRILASAVGDEARLIVVVEQPESLDREALQTLHAMAPTFSGVAPRVQMVFCGPVAFRAKMDPASSAKEPTPEPARRPALAATPASLPAPEPVISPAPRRRWAFVVLASLLVLAATAAFAWRAEPQLRATLGHLIPQPSSAPALAASTAVSAPPTANLAEEEGMLRREFDDFIASRPDAAALTDEQKNGLFNEFLQRRRARVP